MMATPILYYLSLLVLSEICYAGDVIEKEQDRLERNLKVLRKDFNNLIENVEDFAGDFLKQIHEAGRLIGTGGGYTNDEDYNWQDDRINAIKTKNREFKSSVSTTTQPTKTDQKVHDPTSYKSTLSNEIPTRRRRAVQQAPPTRNFDNGPPAPTNFIENGPRQTGPNRETIDQNLIAPVMAPPAPILTRLKPNEEKVAVVGAQHQLETETKPNPKQTCATKTEKEIGMEEQKLEELKMEVKKLNELVALLKDQQKLIKVINEEGGEYNEVDGNLDKDLMENSFLYKTLKQLGNKRKKNEDNNSGVSGSQIDRLKLDLEKTAKTLEETQQILTREKEKEELLEGELKRHNGELKILKTMLENLYDKSKSWSTTAKTKTLRDIDFEDADVSSLLGAVHMPKSLPALIKQSSSVGPIGLKDHVNNSSEFTDGFLKRQQNKNTRENHLNREVNNVEDQSNFLSETSRASSMNDLDLRLKLINLLANKEKSEQEMKAKRISDALAKLVQPEKRTDDDMMLDALRDLVKDKREPKKDTEEDLRNLIKTLNNGNVQSKGDDTDIELELRQLQRAISSLRPKEDVAFDNVDLLNNRRGKDESRDFQNMLSQIISQNGANAASLNNNAVTAAEANLDKSSLAATQQLLNRYLAAANAPKGNIINPIYSIPYSPNLYSGLNLYPNNGLAYNQPNYQSFSPIPYSNPQPVGAEYGFSNLAYPSSDMFGPTSYPASYNPLYSASYPRIKYPNEGYLSTGSVAGFYGGNPVRENTPEVTNQLFPATAGGNYQGNNYGPASYAGPSLDKPYGIGQNSDQYKSGAGSGAGVITDLTQQVQNLENVITSLNKGGDYAQTANDKATIAGLEKRIYELKGVINSLSQPTSSYAQPAYGTAQTHGSTQPTSPSQPASYGSRPQLNDGQYSPPQLPPSPSAPPNAPSYANQDGVTPYPSQASYQPKGSSRRRRQASLERLWDTSEDENYWRREKRQILGGGVPPVAVNAPNEADISVDLRQTPVFNDPALGNAALSKVASIFKSYLEQNLNQDATERHALDDLDLKLNALKTQLESRKSSPRSLPDSFGLSAPYQNHAYLPSLYGGNVEYVSGGKSKDIITIILEKIIDSLFRLLPKVVTALFGQSVIGIGDSYGDYYSPLQNVLRNLGPVGYLPLVLIKLLESVGAILKHLKNNQFFKQFLLPGSILGLVAGSIFFLIYFYQQDEPYGYIGYQASGSDYYPKYEPNRYGNPYSTIINNNNNNGNVKEKLPLPNYRQSNILYAPVDVNKFTGLRSNIDTRPATLNAAGFGNNYYYNGNALLPYSRGYYDYFK